MMDPIRRRQWERFRKNRRAYWSLAVLGVAFTLSLGAEFLCNNRPIVIYFDGQLYFPLLKRYEPKVFGEIVAAEVDFRELIRKPWFARQGNWAVFPLIPHHPNSSLVGLPTPPPSPPTSGNWLGTDDRGRDLASRLLYGFRNSMFFALSSWVAITILAFLIGAGQGFLGGRVDFYTQRVTEIWSALPVLYVIIFLLSIFSSSLSLLTLVWVAFSWIGLSTYIRAEVLRVRSLDYITAARALGASTPRILFRHLLPNAMTPIITFAPFIISASVGSLAALDYLGLGLPPPTASWGELLRQGKENLQSWWLSIFPFLALFLTLLLLNFVGEGVRAAFDGKDSR